MDNETFLELCYMEQAEFVLDEAGMRNPLLNDIWNDRVDSKQISLKNGDASTGIKLDLAKSNQVPNNVFNIETGRLLIPFAQEQELAKNIRDEVLTNYTGDNFIQAMRAMKTIMSKYDLSKEEVDIFIRKASPTLAGLFDEFTKIISTVPNMQKRGDEAKLDFSSEISKLISLAAK
jgi:hypothetical protein